METYYKSITYAFEVPKWHLKNWTWSFSIMDDLKPSPDK